MKKPTLSCSVCERPMWKGRGSKTDGTQKCLPCRRASPAEVTAAVRACVDCGTEYKWKRDRRCSPCRYTRAKQRALESGNLCSECGSPAIAKGLCSTHASYRSRSVAGRKRTAYAKACKFCEVEFTTTTNTTEFCSLEHAQRYRNGWTSCTEVVVRLKPRVWIGESLQPRLGAPMVAGQCAHCPTYFVGAHGARYCSDACATRASWKRRYERRGEFSVSAKTRHMIYDRDGWLCQLCDNPVDPNAPVNTIWSATLDHIVPQSRQLVPDHSPKNLRLAHLWCNSARGDGSNMSEDEFRSRVSVKFSEMSLAA